MVLWFYVQEHRKGQLVVVLILKHLKRRGRRLKSYPTDLKKWGIKPIIINTDFITYEKQIHLTIYLTFFFLNGFTQENLPEFSRFRNVTLHCMSEFLYAVYFFFSAPGVDRVPGSQSYPRVDASQKELENRLKKVVVQLKTGEAINSSAIKIYWEVS